MFARLVQAIASLFPPKEVPRNKYPDNLNYEGNGTVATDPEYLVTTENFKRQLEAAREIELDSRE